MIHKKGDIWISAVLYMALGVVVLTIVLAAGVPMIQKMKDKNSFSQAKDVFFSLNENIKDVATDGPGSKRYIAPFEITTGELSIDEVTGMVKWQMKTKAKLMEPSYNFRGEAINDPVLLFHEGDLIIYAQDTNIVDEYLVNIELDYSTLAKLRINSPFQGPFSGTYSLTITHTGEYEDDLPVVEIQIMP